MFLVCFVKEKKPLSNISNYKCMKWFIIIYNQKCKAVFNNTYFLNRQCSYVPIINVLIKRKESFCLIMLKLPNNCWIKIKRREEKEKICFFLNIAKSCTVKTMFAEKAYQC